MKSENVFIYPQLVWQNGEKMLWNPIHRKALKNRPEERVRLRTIECFISAGWSKHRISTEESVGPFADSAMRTDIICYSRKFEPVILVECKAEHVPISAKTARQTARYNQNVGAPFLMMTNGRSDFWYEIRDNKIHKLEQKPSILNSKPSPPVYEFEDWRKRGFIGNAAIPALRKWMGVLLPKIWSNGKSEEILFLSFNQALSDLNLNHYYRIKSFPSDRRIAFTTINTPFGGSRLAAILNQDQENQAVIEINLDLLFDGRKGNASVYSEAVNSTFDLNTYFDLRQIKNVGAIFQNLNTVFEKVLD